MNVILKVKLVVFIFTPLQNRGHIDCTRFGQGYIMNRRTGKDKYISHFPYQVYWGKFVYSSTFYGIEQLTIHGSHSQYVLNLSRHVWRWTRTSTLWTPVSHYPQVLKNVVKPLWMTIEGIALTLHFLSFPRPHICLVKRKSCKEDCLNKLMRARMHVHCYARSWPRKLRPPIHAVNKNFLR